MFVLEALARLPLQQCLLLMGPPGVRTAVEPPLPRTRLSLACERRTLALRHVQRLACESRSYARLCQAMLYQMASSCSYVGELQLPAVIVKPRGCCGWAEALWVHALNNA